MRLNLIFHESALDFTDLDLYRFTASVFGIVMDVAVIGRYVCFLFSTMATNTAASAT
jgi:hypothetical protein